MGRICRPSGPAEQDLLKILAFAQKSRAKSHAMNWLLGNHIYILKGSFGCWVLNKLKKVKGGLQASSKAGNLEPSRDGTGVSPPVPNAEDSHKALDWVNRQVPGDLNDILSRCLAIDV